MSMLEVQRTDVDRKTVIRDELSSKTNNFIWRIRFSEPLDAKTVNALNMYVTTINNEPVRTSIRYNRPENTIEIRPLKDYIKGTDYYLVISTNVKSESGKSLKRPTKLLFKIKPATEETQ